MSMSKINMTRVPPAFRRVQNTINQHGRNNQNPLNQTQPMFMHYYSSGVCKQVKSQIKGKVMAGLNEKHSNFTRNKAGLSDNNTETTRNHSNKSIDRNLGETAMT